jgi:signal transduction histidine kinase
VLGAAVLVQPETFERRLTTVLAVGAMVTLLHAVSRAGRPKLASWMLVVGLTLLVTQRAWITGGIHAPVEVFYALFIVMAAALLGTRGAVVTAAISLLGASVLTAATSLHWLTPRPGAGSPLAALIFVVLAIGIALVLQTLIARRRDTVAVDAVQMFVHDMRSPLQILLAHLDVLREDAHGESAEHVDGAIRGAKALNRITNSLLDVSRLEAGGMPIDVRATDVSVLARSVVASMTVLQPERKISVQALDDTACACDAELIRRVIENLVSNAMKHTPVDGRMGIVVSGLANRVRIAVHDEGPGMPLEMRARMFEPFSSSGTRSISGLESSGLGLAFCRLAVEAHGGTIRVEDGHPRGSIFIVELRR